MNTLRYAPISQLWKLLCQTKKPKCMMLCRFYLQGGLCFYCRLPMNLRKKHRKDKSTIEHLVPLSKGGKDKWYNIVAACKSCNNNRAQYGVMDYVI